MREPLKKRIALHTAVLLAAAAASVGGLTTRAAIEPAISPTVHPTLSPTSAISLPLVLRADTTSVWRIETEQRMLLHGGVHIEIGYRNLTADTAAVWLTPSKESGEAVYDVAIYLSGNVRVIEGKSNTATTTAGSELLVTTRIGQDVRLESNPVSKSEEENAIVKRGSELRFELLSKPSAPPAIPNITITDAEQALQNGWIARGPNNRIIRGPGEIQIVRGPNGEPIELPVETRPAVPGAKKPVPAIFATGDDVSYHFGQANENEDITMIRGAYLFYDGQDKKPPMEFHARRMVLFSPKQGAPGATRPARSDLASYVTGAYLEGEVTLESGVQTIRAERIYIDFTSMRAVMLDATLATVDEVRNVPLYMRAGEIRMLARGEFAAKKATFSTSEFHTPHYHIGASEVYLQDISPRETGEALAGPGTNAQAVEPGAAGPTGGTEGQGATGNGGGTVGIEPQGALTGDRTYLLKAKDATINVQGVPIFYWPYLQADTAKNDIPLRRIRFSNSKTFGFSIQTQWDIFGLAGQREPEGVRANLNIDYFGKRGPAGGVDATWLEPDSRGFLRSYAMMDQGIDRLGKDQPDLTPADEGRGRVLVRHKQDFGDGWSAQVEAAYLSDPTFLEQFYQGEFATDKEQETSVYLKKQREIDALSILGKFHLFDFTAVADRIDDEFITDKKPEVKYWRIGDNFFDLFTYYSESGLANVNSVITDRTPADLGVLPSFLGGFAAAVPANVKFRDFYRAHGWTTDDVLRADTRHEIDMPLQLGDLKLTPFATARVTAWDDAFPDTEGGNTVRVWGGGGIRGAMQFWKVYEDVNSIFFNVHRLRHVIEPNFVLFAGGANEQRKDLQPFDPDVEGMSRASGLQLALNQKWQTKRGEPGKERNVDWLTLNVAWNQFWNKDDPGTFFLGDPLRGYLFSSRPELSQVRNSVAVDGIWRMGERTRFMGEANYNTDDNRVEQFATGFAVDQTNSLSYFIGNRYVRALTSDEWTIGIDYQLTRKYQVIAAQSYDFELKNNILSSVTLVRKLPRFNAAVTVQYDANQADTAVIVTMWPEGFPELGFGSNRTSNLTGR